MDGVTVDDTTVHETGLAVEAGLFPEFPARSFQGRLPFPQASGDGLPEACRLPAQESQYLAIVRVDDDQDRFWTFELVVQEGFGSVTGSLTRICSSLSCSSLAVPGASVSLSLIHISEPTRP